MIESEPQLHCNKSQPAPLRTKVSGYAEQGLPIQGGKERKREREGVEKFEADIVRLVITNEYCQKGVS